MLFLKITGLAKKILAPFWLIFFNFRNVLLFNLYGNGMRQTIIPPWFYRWNKWSWEEKVGADGGGPVSEG